MTDGPSDTEVERLLLAADEHRWGELWAAVAALSADPAPGRWAGGEREAIAVDGGERTVIQMPYVNYSDTVHRTIQCVYMLGANLPFDWRSWDGLNRYPRGRGLETAPVAESVRMVTAIVRADRFCEGTILACIHDGTLDAAIRRLRHWHDEQRPPDET